MKTIDINWFNLHPKAFRMFGVGVKLFNFFNRKNMQRGDGSIEHHWGIGLLQVNGRHLLYLGSIGFTALFLHETNKMLQAEFYDYRGEHFELLPRISYSYCLRKVWSFDWLWWEVEVVAHKYRKTL